MKKTFLEVMETPLPAGDAPAETGKEAPDTKGVSMHETIVQASRKLLDAGQLDHARLVHDIYDRAVQVLAKDPMCASCFAYIALIEAIGNSSKTPDLVNVAKVRKELSLPASGPENVGQGGDDFQTGKTGTGEQSPHPDLDETVQPKDVSVYLESFRFPSK